MGPKKTASLSQATANGSHNVLIWPRGDDYNRSGCDTPPPSYLSKLWGGGELEGLGGGGRLEGVGGGGGRPGGGGSQSGGATRDPLLPHAYLQGGCVSGAGLGKLLVAVVKQGLQMGRCVHSGCGVFTSQRTTFV